MSYRKILVFSLLFHGKRLYGLLRPFKYVAQTLKHAHERSIVFCVRLCFVSLIMIDYRTQSND